MLCQQVGSNSTHTTHLLHVAHQNFLTVNGRSTGSEFGRGLSSKMTDPLMPNMPGKARRKGEGGRAKQHALCCSAKIASDAKPKTAIAGSQYCVGSRRSIAPHPPSLLLPPACRRISTPTLRVHSKKLLDYCVS